MALDPATQSGAGQAPGQWSAADIDHLAARYGYRDWGPPDAGNSLRELASLGAGRAQHDRRYLSGRGSRLAGRGYGESTFEFLRRYDGDKPFCRFVSLVNPHDIFVYPGRYRNAGFRLKDFKDLPIELPPTFDEDLSGKPAVHRLIQYYFNRHDPIDGSRQTARYVRFYAWLHQLVDSQINDLLDLLAHLKLTDRTLIVRTSDHGEMGMAHGGLRQKEYNCYEETMRVPMVFSNPRLFPREQQTDCLASLIDLLRSVARIAGAPRRRYGFRGVDLSRTLASPTNLAQQTIHFTYDDDFLPDVGIPRHIRAIREPGWKYAVYFDPMSGELEYELYDLVRDPLETTNLAFGAAEAATRAAWRRLHRKLIRTMIAAGTMPDSVRWPGLPAGAAGDDDKP